MRGDLRLDDLRKERAESPSKLMNVKVPAAVSDGIDMIVEELRVTKTEVVTALLNEGLDAFAEKFPHLKKGARGEATKTSPGTNQE